LPPPSYLSWSSEPEGTIEIFDVEVVLSYMTKTMKFEVKEGKIDLDDGRRNEDWGGGGKGDVFFS